MNAQTLRGGRGNFFVERGFETTSRNTRMPFRIGADTDLLDAGFAQAAFLDNRECVNERPWRINIAADHQ